MIHHYQKKGSKEPEKAVAPPPSDNP